MTIFSVTASCLLSYGSAVSLCFSVFTVTLNDLSFLLSPLAPHLLYVRSPLSFASVLFFLPLFSFHLFLSLIVFFCMGEPVKGRWWSWLWPLVWPSKMTLPISLTCRKQRRQHHHPIRSPLLRRGTG